MNKTPKLGSSTYVLDPRYFTKQADGTFTQGAPGKLLDTKVSELETKVKELTEVVEALQSMLMEVIERTQGTSTINRKASQFIQTQQQIREAQRKAEEYARKVGLANPQSYQEQMEKDLMAAKQETMKRALLHKFQGMGITDPEELLIEF